MYFVGSIQLHAKYMYCIVFHWSGHPVSILVVSILVHTVYCTTGHGNVSVKLHLITRTRIPHDCTVIHRLLDWSLSSSPSVKFLFFLSFLLSVPIFLHACASCTSFGTDFWCVSTYFNWYWCPLDRPGSKTTFRRLHHPD